MQLGPSLGWNLSLSLSHLAETERIEAAKTAAWKGDVSRWTLMIGWEYG